MKYLIKIDKKTIQINPNAGQDSYIIPGMIYQDENGDTHREYERIRSLTREPKFIFKYENTQVACKYCGKSFSYKDLKEDEVECECCGNHYEASNVCPYCNEPDCCEIKFENINEVKIREEIS